MTEILRFHNPTFREYKNTFTVYMPEVSLLQVNSESLPNKLKERIGDKKCIRIYLKITHPDESASFVAEEPEFEVFYLGDVDETGKSTGDGQTYIESCPESEDPDIPVVGDTHTEDHCLRQGLGRRRLFIMNALVRAKFNSPLHSTTSPRPLQRRIWDKLVEEEYAEVHYWNKEQRYRFL